MASTYSTDLRLELIGSGEQSGVWGSTTNLNLGELVEQAIAGVEAIVVPSSNYALISYYGAVDESRNAVLVLSSGAAANVYVPPVNKVYVVKNTGSYAITMYNSTVIGNTTAGGTGVAVAAGTAVLLFTDGTNFYTGGFPTSSTTGTGNVVLSASPTLTGVPLAPTANAGTNTTQIATTAFVLANGVPSGAIMLWSGSVASIPSGWLLCNGSSGTPDLRDRFIVGAGSTYAVAATGGSANATLVSHTHTATSTVTDPGHTHTPTVSTGKLTNGINGSGGSYFGGGTEAIIGVTLNSNTTGITVATTNSTEGSSATNANLPPYYALAYIMKA
jgi:hypothetical protein